MRLLLAAPDRDFLRSYGDILSEALGETVTAFDGAQVLTLLAEERFDGAILDRSIPRVEYRRLVSRLYSAGIPVIVLLNEAPSSRLLQGDALPNAYLRYPFAPEALIRLVRDILDRASRPRRFTVAGLTADTKSLRLGSERVTQRELEILSALSEGVPLPEGQNEVYIGVLNDKLARQNAAARIRYRTVEGYQLVTS